MKLRCSVIVPAFNAAGTLSACLASIVPGDEMQEIIVVDDGSTDGTGEIARQAGATVVEQARQGPAAARNAGAAVAGGDLLVFVDSDVLVHPDAIGRIVNALDANPGLAAVFGGYDAAPRVRGVVARYRNLLHAYTHQTGAEEACTFWAGLGGVRRQAFDSVGGFDAGRYESASIEDIEFGMRLRAAGRRVRLERAILGTHCKEWTLFSMVWTDLWCRAVPWTRLLRQSGKMPDDLNLRWGQRISVAASWSLPACLALVALDPRWVALPLFAAVLYLTLNAGFFGWVLRHNGAPMAAASIPLHLLFHWVAGLGFLVGSLSAATGEARAAAPRGAART